MARSAHPNPGLVALVVALLVQALALCVSAQSPEHFNLTAIGAANGKSIIECWQIKRPFDVSTDPGTAGSKAQQLGDLTNLTLTVLPPRFDGGLHNAPFVQYVAFTSGLAVVSLPNSTDQATIKGGKYGFIIAADIASVSDHGHITKYPTKETTVALQIRIKDNIPPDHTILHSGACRPHELSGL